jgi:hypothetical protein
MSPLQFTDLVVSVPLLTGSEFWFSFAQDVQILGPEQFGDRAQHPLKAAMPGPNRNVHLSPVPFP